MNLDLCDIIRAQELRPSPLEMQRDQTIAVKERLREPLLGPDQSELLADNVLDSADRMSECLRQDVLTYLSIP